MRENLERGKKASGLTQAQLEELRGRLVQARREALVQLRDAEATARSAESLPEPMDAAELAREQGDAALLVARERARLGEVDHALAKLEAGRYGVSERSGEPIAFAIPTSFLIACASATAPSTGSTSSTIARGGSGPVRASSAARSSPSRYSITTRP